MRGTYTIYSLSIGKYRYNVYFYLGIKNKQLTKP